MEGGGAFSAEEAQAVRESILSAEDQVEPSARQGLRLGRWAAGLCAGAAAAAMAVAALWGGGLDPGGSFPPGLDTTGSLGSVVELTSAQTFAQMLDAVNHERQKQGLGDLCYNEKLNAAAQTHTNDMARHKKLSHTGPSDGSSFSQRITKAGYSWRGAAENIAAGQTSVKQVMASWMKSPGHRRNILTKDRSHFGFAMKDNYWTQLFAAPLGSEGCMLAGGGADGTGGRCRDVVPKGQQNWHDSDGKGYHCNWYAQGSHCSDHGSKYKNFGYTAQQACCACGGGGKSSGCTDKVPPGKPEWYAPWGKQYHCDWYAGDASTRCSKWGSRPGAGGLTAKQACCVCGGGGNAADRPATTTKAPAPASGACCNEHCQSSSDCAGSQLFC